MSYIRFNDTIINKAKIIEIIIGKSTNFLHDPYYVKISYAKIYIIGSEINTSITLIEWFKSINECKDRLKIIIGDYIYPVDMKPTVEFSEWFNSFNESKDRLKIIIGDNKDIIVSCEL